MGALLSKSSSNKDAAAQQQAAAAGPSDDAKPPTAPATEVGLRFLSETAEVLQKVNKSECTDGSVTDA